MDKNAIIKQITSLPGIKQLNALQSAILDCNARRIKLIAPTGSGKTLAFAIALLKHLPLRQGIVTGVVIVPTRELAIQVRATLAAAIPGSRIISLYGGHQMQEEVASLTDIPEIVVATPGRLLDHITKHTIDISGVDMAVIDEYDKCLELGFEAEMKRILTKMHKLKGIILTSATSAVQIPVYLDFSQSKTLDFGCDTGVNTGHCTIFDVPAQGKDKLKDCIALLKTLAGEKTMIFVNHRESADRVYDALCKAGLHAGLYHGGLDQQEREKGLILFDTGVTPYLVTTDLGARGLDISDVANIVHYHLPVSEETWLHRNGRTARMGKDGRAFVLTAPQETLPDYIVCEGLYHPCEHPAERVIPEVGALYFSAGKKDKISRGDILGFLIKTGGLEPGDIGKIDVRERCSYVIVKADKITKAFLDHLNSSKIKNSKVRISSLS